jgi:hypothetical protein
VLWLNGGSDLGARQLAMARWRSWVPFWSRREALPSTQISNFLLLNLSKYSNKICFDECDREHPYQMRTFSSWSPLLVLDSPTPTPPKISATLCQVIQFLNVCSFLFPSFPPNKVRVGEFVPSRTTRSERGLRGRRGVVVRH